MGLQEQVCKYNNGSVQGMCVALSHLSLHLILDVLEEFGHLFYFSCG